MVDFTSFSQKIAAESTVPMWFFEARKNGSGQEELVARIRQELSSHLPESAGNPEMWDDAFIDQICEVIYRVYLSRM